MLNHPTLDKLHALKFTGMARALNEQMDQPEIEQLSFEQRLGLLVDREMTERADRRLTSRLRQARGLDKALMADLDRLRPGPQGVSGRPYRPLPAPAAAARANAHRQGRRQLPEAAQSARQDRRYRA